MSYDSIDKFLAQISKLIAYLESASVPDSAKFRLQQTLESWKTIERRWIEIREQEKPATFNFLLGLEGTEVSEKMAADYAWVKSQLNHVALQLEESTRSGRGRKMDADRQKSINAIRDVLEKHPEQVLTNEFTENDVEDELISINAVCWHPGGWHDPTVKTLIYAEIKQFRESRKIA